MSLAWARSWSGVGWLGWGWGLAWGWEVVGASAAGWGVEGCDIFSVSCFSFFFFFLFFFCFLCGGVLFGTFENAKSGRGTYPGLNIFKMDARESGSCGTTQY